MAARAQRVGPARKYGVYAKELSVCLTPDQADYLTRVRQQTGCTYADAIRSAIDQARGAGEA